MDAIRNLVAGADPVGQSGGSPDAERALRAVLLSRPEDFVERLPATFPTLVERRQRRARRAGALAVAAAAAAAAGLLAMNVGPWAAMPLPAATSIPVTPSATASAQPSATPSADASEPAPAPTDSAPSGSAVVAPANAWVTYRSADGKVSFDHPEEWVVASKAVAPGSPALNLDVNDVDGKTIASLHYGAAGGIGGGCTNPVPYEVLDSQELPLPYNAAAPGAIPPRFAYRVLLEGVKVTASYGLTSSTAGADGRSCMFYNVVSGPAESPLYSFADVFQVSAHDLEATGAKTFRSLDEARAYMLTPEYADARRMITSLQVQAGQ